MPGWQFEVFNLVFICIYQPLLLMATAAPVAVAAASPDSPLGAIDVVAAALFSTLLCGETVADMQM
jgi:steroid 5-alpha reductase family enzyme